MTRFAENTATRRSSLTFLLWLLIAIYAAARILQVSLGKVPTLEVVALHVLPPLLFALIHGAMYYRARGILAFVAISVVVGGALSMWVSELDFRSVITTSQISWAPSYQ